ncbi:MAG TPA: ArsB/NhaD family transporter [Alphaproteobacteria bacterium]|nr:ArsB/NhaD family transporter [Alphaproteobacteria bacterium]
MNWFVPIIFLLTAVIIFYLAIKKPHIQIRKYRIETYAIGALVGPLILFFTGYLASGDISSLTIGQVNPFNILILFLSMVFISIYLDEAGLMEYFARLALKFSGISAKKLFFSLYATVSIMTIFTSNDIIILTLTPFIYYFTKHAKLDPKPFLIAEFFAANTLSILLIIGNPTNIYIASSYGIGFLEYLKAMILPSVIAMLVNISLLYLIFRKSLEKKFRPENSNPSLALKDKTGAIIGSVILGICTILLVISQAINIPMWKISFFSALALVLIIFIRESYSINKKSEGSSLVKVFKRMPWSIVVFVLSFFLMTQALFKSINFGEVYRGVWLATGSSDLTILSIGFSSAIIANIINNIPMSVVFTKFIEFIPQNFQHAGIYAAIIGSNIGAYFTPFGALAGLMWMNILKDKGMKITYGEFIKYGLICGLLTLLGALIGLIIFI